MQLLTFIKKFTKNLTKLIFILLILIAPYSIEIDSYFYIVDNINSHCRTYKYYTSLLYFNNFVLFFENIQLCVERIPKLYYIFEEKYYFKIFIYIKALLNLFVNMYSYAIVTLFTFLIILLKNNPKRVLKTINNILIKNFIFMHYFKIIIKPLKTNILFFLLFSIYITVKKNLLLFYNWVLFYFYLFYNFFTIIVFKIFLFNFNFIIIFLFFNVFVKNIVKIFKFFLKFLVNSYIFLKLNFFILKVFILKICKITLKLFFYFWYFLIFLFKLFSKFYTWVFIFSQRKIRYPSLYKILQIFYFFNFDDFLFKIATLLLKLKIKLSVVINFIINNFIYAFLGFFYLFIKNIGLPLRIFIRIFNLLFCLIRGFLFLLLYDLTVLLRYFYLFFKNNYYLEIFKRNIFYIFIFIFIICFDKIFLVNYIHNSLAFSFYFKKYIFYFIQKIDYIYQPTVISFLFLCILAEIGSLYYMTSSSKFVNHSICYSILYILYMFIYILPEYTLIVNFLFKCGGFSLLFIYTFRSLREDYRVKIPINAFLIGDFCFTAKISKNYTVIFGIYDKIINVFLEHFILYIYIIFICLLLFDLRDSFYYLNSFNLNFNYLSQFQLYLIVLYILVRQSTYSYFIWLIIFSYYVIWSFISIVLVSTTNYSYLGILNQNTINEVTALGSVGLISSLFGLEHLIFNLKNSEIVWYFGEIFYNQITKFSILEKNDNIFITNTPFNPFGDMYSNPYIFTPNDDHNWVIFETLEKTYFNSVKLEKSNSDSSSGDTEKFWPIDRNLYIWFGEFLENDIYYGWSNYVLIDTQTYFDYSPYGLTNILGDSFMKNLITDILSIFVGPSELDESGLLNINEWGSNYTPGSTSNRFSGGMSSGLESSFNLNIEQKVRENGENYHEWFPGLYVLDGKFDSKFSYFYIKLFLFLIFPFSIFSVWYTILGKKSNFFDESFGELEFTNYNFYFFGNEQNQTFSTYFWNEIYNTNFEWPSDAMPLDPVAYEPTSNLFEEIFRHFQSGLFNHSILDSYFYVPILKHTEGFNTDSYKDFLMPLLFPTNIDSKSSRIEDFGKFYENFKKIKNNTKNQKTREDNKEFLNTYLTWDSKLNHRVLAYSNLNDSWPSDSEEEPDINRKFGFGDLINFTSANKSKKFKNKKKFSILNKMWLNRRFFNFNKNKVTFSNKINISRTLKYASHLKRRNIPKIRSESYRYFKKYNNFINTSNVLLSDKSLDIKDLIFRLEESNFAKKWKKSNNTNQSEKDNEVKSTETEKIGDIFKDWTSSTAERVVDNLAYGQGNKMQSYKKATLPREYQRYVRYWHPNYFNFTYNNKTKFENLASNNTSIDLDLNLINVDGTPILANEVAYENNVEYSNLFESLILEMISPDGQRHRDLEYEFDSSQPEFSTISELADPEGNFNESGIFENDTVIDDPRTEMLSEWEDSVENMDNILTFFLSEKNLIFWHDTPDEHYIFSIEPENTNISSKNIFKKKSTKNYISGIEGEEYGKNLNEDSIGYGSGFMQSDELVGASSDPDKNYKFTDSELKDGFFKYFLTTKKLLIKSGLRQAIQHKIQSIKYYNIKKFKVGIEYFFDDEKRDLIRIKNKIERISDMVNNYIKYRFDIEIFNNKFIDNNILNLYKLKKFLKEEYPEHLISIIPTKLNLTKISPKLNYRFSKNYKIYIKNLIVIKLINTVKIFSIKKNKYFKFFNIYNNYVYFKKYKNIFKKTKINNNSLVIHSKSIFYLTNSFISIILSKLKNIFILWNYFLRLFFFKLKLLCKKINNFFFLNFFKLKLLKNTKFRYRTTYSRFISKTVTYFIFNSFSIYGNFKKYSKFLNNNVIKKYLYKNFLLLNYKKRNISLRKNYLKLNLNLNKYFRSLVSFNYFYKKNIFNKLIKKNKFYYYIAKLKKIKILIKNKKIIYKNIFYIKNKVKSKYLFIVKILRYTLNFFIKNKKKLKLYWNSWYYYIIKIFYIIVEFLWYNFLLIKDFTNLVDFLNFYNYYNFKLIGKKFRFNTNTNHTDLLSSTEFSILFFDNTISYYLITKIFFSNILSFLFLVKNKKLNTYFYLNVVYILKFSTKINFNFKKFKICYSFLRIVKPSNLILKKLIDIKNIYGNFIPYSFKTIVVILDTNVPYTDNKLSIETYFNFYKIVKFYNYILKIFHLLKILIKKINLLGLKLNMSFFTYIEKIELLNINNIFNSISNLVLKPLVLYFKNSTIFKEKINNFNNNFKNLFFNNLKIIKKKIQKKNIFLKKKNKLQYKQQHFNTKNISQSINNIDSLVRGVKNKINSISWYFLEKKRKKEKIEYTRLDSYKPTPIHKTNPQLFSFNKEYSSIWLKELLWQSKQNIYQDPTNTSFGIYIKKLKYCISGNFYDIINLVPIRLKFRKYLKKKYNNFIYKNSIFLIGLGSNSCLLRLNELFFTDISEIFSKLILTKIINFHTFKAIDNNYFYKLSRKKSYKDFILPRQKNIITYGRWNSYINNDILLNIKNYWLNFITTSNSILTFYMLGVKLSSVSRLYIQEYVENFSEFLDSSADRVDIRSKIQFLLRKGWYKNQKFKNLKIWIKFPKIAELRDSWSKNYSKYTLLPNFLLTLKNYISLLFIQNILKSFFILNKNLNFLNLKKTIYLLKFKTKLDNATIWYIYKKNIEKKIPSSFEFDIKFYRIDELVFSFNMNKVFKSSIQKIFYLKKIWNLTKNYGNIGKLIIKNIFWHQFKKNKKIKNMSTFLEDSDSIIRLLYFTNFKNNISMSKINYLFSLNNLRSVLDKGNFLFNNLQYSENFITINLSKNNSSWELLTYSQNYISYLLFLKILKLLNFGYLQNKAIAGKFISNVFILNYTNTTSIEDSSWVISTYSRLNTILNFKNTKYLDFLDWRFLLLHNFNYISVKKKKKIFFYALLLVYNNINIEHWDYFKYKFYKNNIYFIKNYLNMVIKVMNPYHMRNIKKIFIPNLNFKNDKNSIGLVYKYNSDQTRDFIITFLENKMKSQSFNVFFNFGICDNYVFLNWKEKKTTTLLFLSTIKKLKPLPQIRQVQPLFYNFLFIFEKTQPITAEDVVYFSDYSKYFLHKITYFIKLKKINLLIIYKKNIEYLVNLVNLKFINRLDWYSFKSITNKKLKRGDMFKHFNTLDNISNLKSNNILQTNAVGLNFKNNILLKKIENFKINNLSNNYDKIAQESVNFEIEDQHWAELEKDVQVIGSSESSFTGFSSLLFGESLKKKKFIEYTATRYLNMLSDEFTSINKGNPFYFESQLNTLRSFGYNIPVLGNDDFSFLISDSFPYRLTYPKEDAEYGHDNEHMDDMWTDYERNIRNLEIRSESGSRIDRFRSRNKIKILNKKYKYKRHMNVRLKKWRDRSEIFRKYKIIIDSYSGRPVRVKNGYAMYYKKKRLKSIRIRYLRKRRKFNKRYKNTLKAYKKNIYNKNLPIAFEFKKILHTDLLDKSLVFKKLNNIYRRKIKKSKYKDWRFADKFELTALKKPNKLYISYDKKINKIVLNRQNKDMVVYDGGGDSIYKKYNKFYGKLFSLGCRNFITFNKFSWFRFNKFKNNNFKNFNRFNVEIDNKLTSILDFDIKFWKIYYNLMGSDSPVIRKKSTIKDKMFSKDFLKFKKYWKFNYYKKLTNTFKINSTNLISNFFNLQSTKSLIYFLKKSYNINNIKSKFLLTNFLSFGGYFVKNRKKLNKSILFNPATVNSLLFFYNDKSFFIKKINKHLNTNFIKKEKKFIKFKYLKDLIKDKNKIIEVDPTFVIMDAKQKTLRNLLVLSSIEGFKYSWIDDGDTLKFHNILGEKSKKKQRKWLVWLKYRYDKVFRYYLKNTKKKRKIHWQTDGNKIFKLRGRLTNAYFRKDRTWYSYKKNTLKNSTKYRRLHLESGRSPKVGDDFDQLFQWNPTINNRVWTLADPRGLKFNYSLEIPISTDDQAKIYISKIKNQFLDSPALTKEMIFRIFPFFLEGGWSGSDSGQTAIGSNSPIINSKDPEYRVFYPIFGFYLLNFSRLNRDIKQLGWNFTEKLISFETLRRSFFIFVSDHDTQFYDDKVVHIHNFWLFWLEFFRHIFINRWTLVYNYTNSNKNMTELKYPIGILHDFYWFKYLIFSRYIKKHLQNFSNNFINLRNIRKKNILNSQSRKNTLRYFIFLNIIINLTKIRNIGHLKKLKLANDSTFFNFKYLNKYKNLEFLYLLNTKIKLSKKKTISITQYESNHNNFPNINKYFNINSSFYNSIIFSRNLSWRHSKVTNPVMTYFKPYDNTEILNQYDEVLFEFDPELPIKRFTYNWFVYADLGVSNPWNYESDSDSNMYKLRDYPNKEPIQFRGDIANIENRIVPELSLQSSFIWDENGELDLKKVPNKLENLRDSSRKDSNLKLKRNWFFSNHMVDSSLNLSAYTGNWLLFSDFEVDAQRARVRNLKHGSKYRLNFNTELWWARTELPNYNFRRVDGLEYDVDFGALDSDGEIFHLQKGLLDVAHLPENLDIFETSLPLFERSILDPESPALNEDGEFPEFDLNVEYNNEIIKRLQFSNKTNVYLPKKHHTKWFGEPPVTTSTEWHTELEYITEDNEEFIMDFDGNRQFLKDRQSSYRFKMGHVDWSDKSFSRNLKFEIFQLENSSKIRKNNYNYSSNLKIVKEVYNNFDLNIFDLADTVDVLSVKSLHPTSFSIEGIFGELIETKIDEAVEYNFLSGISYNNLFLNYKFFKKYKKLNWYFLDIISELNLNTLENSYGFDFDLILYKHSSNYWKIILELDSNWNQAYSFSFPQINDSSSNIDEYLPVWNYDPSLWEYAGIEYDISPLTIKDDSKVLLNSKIARFDLNQSWIAQRDLKDNGISINNLGWGGTNIIDGLAAHLPYDMLFGSDVDSDFEVYSELLFFKNLEDNLSDLDSNYSEDFLTSNTSTDEYPQHGWSRERAYNLVSNVYLGKNAKTEDFSDNSLNFDRSADTYNGDLAINPEFVGDDASLNVDDGRDDSGGEGFSSVSKPSTAGNFGVPVDISTENNLSSDISDSNNSRLASKYYWYGPDDSSPSFDFNSNLDLEFNDFFEEDGAEEENEAFREAQADMSYIQQGNEISDGSAQYYLGWEPKTWKYTINDPEIESEFLEEDIDSDTNLIDLGEEDILDLNYVNFINLTNSKSLIVTDSVWKTIYSDFISTYSYQISDVKLYDGYSPNNYEPYFLNKSNSDICDIVLEENNEFFLFRLGKTFEKTVNAVTSLKFTHYDINNFKKLQINLKKIKQNGYFFLNKNKKYTHSKILITKKFINLNKFSNIFFKPLDKTELLKFFCIKKKNYFFQNKLFKLKLVERVSKSSFNFVNKKELLYNFNIKNPYLFYKKTKNNRLKRLLNIYKSHVKNNELSVLEIPEDAQTLKNNFELKSIIPRNFDISNCIQTENKQIFESLSNAEIVYGEYKPKDLVVLNNVQYVRIKPNSLLALGFDNKFINNNTKYFGEKVSRAVKHHQQFLFKIENGFWSFFRDSDNYLGKTYTFKINYNSRLLVQDFKKYQNLPVIKKKLKMFITGRRKKTPRGYFIGSKRIKTKNIKIFYGVLFRYFFSTKKKIFKLKTLKVNTRVFLNKISKKSIDFVTYRKYLPSIDNNFLPIDGIFINFNKDWKLNNTKYFNFLNKNKDLVLKKNIKKYLNIFNKKKQGTVKKHMYNNSISFLSMLRRRNYKDRWEQTKRFVHLSPWRMINDNFDFKHMIRDYRHARYIFDINAYNSLENYNYSVSNMQLGAKRGGIGDSSHWSSGTEYLGEQFSRAFRPHNDLFNPETNSRRNNRFMYSPELETDHTNHYTAYDTDINPDIYTGSFEVYELTSEMSDLYKNVMSEKDDHIDEFYDDDSGQGVAFEQFSYIDWGFDTDNDQINSDQNFLLSEKYTGDMQRDRSSESVYLDYIQNEYARELRQNPEEIGDWTVSDFYTELYFKHEISEIPVSTNESELYSIDSSNSISDFILGMGDDSYLDEKTLHISDDDSSDYEDWIFKNYGSSPNFDFNLIDKIQTLLQFDSNIKAKTAANVDIFNFTNFLSAKPVFDFDDFNEKSLFDSKINERIFGTEWGDYNKMELEDNSRETIDYKKYQKYLDAFYLEAHLSEIIVRLNIFENLGVRFNHLGVFKNTNKPLEYRLILFNKTNYLKNYRSLMLDLGLKNYMF